MDSGAIDKPKRPVIRYHGGKWTLAPWVISHFPPHRIYVEPYGGAASVLMRKDRAFMEVYNDLDDDVVNLFKILRNDESAEILIRQLELTPWSRTEFFETYQETDDPIEAARRLVVRSFMGFGTTGRRKNMTGFRGKAERKNNSGINNWHIYPQSLRTVVERLRGVLIESRPAIAVIRQQDRPETLFYVDPPYPHSTRTSVKTPSRRERCYAVEMSDDDHRELADVLHSVSGMVVLSGYPCDLYDVELYADWYRVDRIHWADGAKKRTEVLWLNAAAHNSLNSTNTLFDLMEASA